MKHWSIVALILAFNIVANAQSNEELLARWEKIKKKLPEADRKTLSKEIGYLIASKVEDPSKIFYSIIDNSDNINETSDANQLLKKSEDVFHNINAKKTNRKTDKWFLEKQGLNNEVPFFICPFNPQYQVAMNKLILQLIKRLEKIGVSFKEIEL